MTNVSPALAVVRPRATRTGLPDQPLLEDIVADMADEGCRGAVPLVGPPGSGKSTALAHLAAVFAHDERLAFLEEPTLADLHRCPADALKVICMTSLPTRPAIEIRLAPWGLDELIEYLLARHGDACSSVIERLGPAARRAWSPQLATIVLDRFAANPAATEPVTELCAYIDEQLHDAKLSQAVRRSCLTALLQPYRALLNDSVQKVHMECGVDVRALLRHAMVQLPMAAESIVEALAAGSTADLNQPLPEELVEAVGMRCRQNLTTIRELHELLESWRNAPRHPMAASILYVADPSWVPHLRYLHPWNLPGGYFHSAQWSRAKLASADLSKADLSDARLSVAVLASANLSGTRLDRASLCGADLNAVKAAGANLSSAALRNAKLRHAYLSCADLSQADLSGADLTAANLTEANLTSANFTDAQLTGVKLLRVTLEDANFTNATLSEADLSALDLRTVRLDGANLERVNLRLAQLDDIVLPKARFREANLHGAHLTGSKMPLADLRSANLMNCGLAEIHWEGANLQDANLKGATFHMGSSRSGLVGSPLACEGSKTGFYTDDYEDMHFKRPEEVRKANLCGADVRGAKIDGLDFYLVDLRGARLDPAQLTHVRKCGAILEDLIA